MKLTGLEFRYFRSIGAEAVQLEPLRKCNILIGPNNVGKSNVLRAVQKISERLQSRADQGAQLHEVDHFFRQGNKPFQARLFFEASVENEQDARIFSLFKSSRIWFDSSSERGTEWGLTGNSFAELTDWRQANSLLRAVVGAHWPSAVGADEIRMEFIKRGAEIFSKLFRAAVPRVHVVPEFRQIRQGEEYSLDGVGLVGTLGRFQHPEIGKDPDRDKFDRIQEFARQLLNLPRATLEVTRDNPVIVIANDGLRLPSSSYGTGVHELLVLVTAVLSVEQSIVCIEEPEIHLHPRLQRALVDFLLRHTTNTYFLSTHSAALINTIDEELQVFHVERREGATVAGPVLGARGALAAIQDLGFRPSDLLQANAVIWVEGPTDRVFILKWLAIRAPDLKEGKDFVFMFHQELFRLNIDSEQVADDAMVNVLQLNRNALVVIDSDRRKDGDELAEPKRKLAESVESNGGLAWISDGREIENYLDPRVVAMSIKEVRGCEISFECGPFDDFSEMLDNALKAQGAAPLNYSKSKRAFARKLAERFGDVEIEGILRDRIEQVILRLREWRQID